MTGRQPNHRKAAKPPEDSRTTGSSSQRLTKSLRSYLLMVGISTGEILFLPVVSLLWNGGTSVNFIVYQLPESVEAGGGCFNLGRTGCTSGCNIFYTEHSSPFLVYLIFHPSALSLHIASSPSLGHTVEGSVSPETVSFMGTGTNLSSLQTRSQQSAQGPAWRLNRHLSKGC